MNKTWLSAPRVVLALLCVMYLILFVDRVNISTAATSDEGRTWASATRNWGSPFRLSPFLTRCFS